MHTQNVHQTQKKRLVSMPVHFCSEFMYHKVQRRGSMNRGIQVLSLYIKSTKSVALQIHTYKYFARFHAECPKVPSYQQQIGQGV